MFDSLTIARELTEAGIDRAQADVLANAIRQAAEHGDYVTSERLDAALSGLEARLTWRFAGAMLAQTVAIIGGTVALLRLLG